MAKKLTYEELEQRAKKLERELLENKKAKEKLEHRQELFFEGPVIIFTWAAIEDWPEEYVSPNIARFGYKADDFISGRIHYIDIIHPKDIEKIVSEVREYSEFGGASYEQEYRIIQSDGEVRWVYDYTIVRRNNKGKITHYDGYIADITERKQTEEALRESEEKLLGIINSVTDHMSMVDEKHNIVWANDIAKSLFGSDLVGKKCYTAYHGRGKICTPCCVEKCFKDGKTHHYEPEVTTADGSQGTFWCTASVATRHEDGRPKMVVEVARDITGLKRAEEEKRKLEAQFQKAQKFESIGTLAGGIAHDFNNLLMSIQGGTSLILMDIDSHHPHYEMLKIIEKQIKSGANLTSKLLGYASKGRYEVKPTNLNQMVEEISMAFGRTRKQINIHKNLAEDLYAIEADRGQIEQILLNLFINASDAMPGGGDLYLKTKNVAHKDIKSWLYKSKAGNYIELTVRDTGKGMDKITMERIFDPFFTTKEMGRGTGLGLASVYGIIKAHGGYIDVESKENQGTTFEIYLPATTKRVGKAKKDSEKLIKKTGTVLIVDDEADVLKICTSVLENIGYRVLSAKDGQEAIKLYRNNKDEIDIVLLDMIMPNMSGGEVYDRLKEINPEVKVLLSSGYSIDGEATEILNRGCDGFIQKPFDIKKLSAKISKILNNK